MHQTPGIKFFHSSYATKMSVAGPWLVNLYTHFLALVVMILTTFCGVLRVGFGLRSF